MDGSITSKSKTPLTEDQLRRMEENRKKAIERLQQRQLRSPISSRYQLEQNSKIIEGTQKSFPSFDRSSNSSTQSTSRLKNLEQISNEQQAFSDGSKESTLILKQIEEKKAKALERLKCKRSAESSNEGSKHFVHQNLSPSCTSSTGKASILSWRDRFSHEKQCSSSSRIKHNCNEKEKSKASSLIAEINEANINEVQVSKSSSSNTQQWSNHTPAKPADGPPFQIAFVLLSPRRFAAKCKFNANVIGAFKTMSTKAYDAITKTWNFSLSEYDKLVSKLTLLNQRLEVDHIPKKVISMLTELTEKERKQNEFIDLTRIDDSLRRILFPFQEQSVSYGIRSNGRLMIADDMGLGKTIQAISLASYYRSDWPLLVVTPSSVKVSWAKEFVMRIPSLEDNVINVVHTGKDDPTVGLVNILSYDLLPKHLETLRRKHFRVVIADESHFIKNPKAARTKAAMELLKQASRVILLSGTPALSRPIELYTQISAVNPRLFPSTHAYALRYCDAKKNRFGWDYTGSSNLEELRIILESKIMIRRLKSDVLDQLPEKQRKIVILDPSNVNTKSVSCEARKLEVSTGKEKRGALLEYFSATSNAKIKAVLEFISDILEGGTKFILFGHHQLMLNAISEMLRKKKVSFIRIDGGTTAIARMELVERFQTDENCLVAVLSVTAANTGINLTAATTVIFAELYWNPGVLVQAEDRIYRIGQKNAVTVTYLIAENTADDYIWPLVQNKLDVLTSAGLNQDEFSPEVSIFKDPKQKRIFDFFHELLDDDDDYDGHLMNLNEEETEETEPARKRVKAE